MADDGGARARMLAGESVFTPGLGEAIRARVAAGESLRAICREPGQPHRTTVRAWAQAHPDFGEALRAAYRQQRIGARMRDRQRRAAQAKAPPSRGGKACAYTRELGEAICARLANGESLTAIGRDPDMPSFGAVLAWVKRYTEFEDMYVEARRMQADYLFDEARDVALATTPKTVWADRLRFDTIRWMTARMAPRKYCERLVARGDDSDEPVLVTVVSFRSGPNDEILVAPPRCQAEEDAWVAAYGKPYDGPRAS